MILVKSTDSVFNGVFLWRGYVLKNNHLKNEPKMRNCCLNVLPGIRSLRSSAMPRPSMTRRLGPPFPCHSIGDVEELKVSVPLQVR